MAKTLIDLIGAPGLPGMLHRWLGITVNELDHDSAAEIINVVMRDWCRPGETRFTERSDTFRTRLSIRDYDTPEGWSKPRSFWYPAANATTDDQITFIEYTDKDTFDKTFPASGLFGSTFQQPMGQGAFGESDLGEPRLYTVWAGKLMLGPVPNRVFTIYRNWWGLPPDLTDANPANEFTKQAWDYLLYAGLVEATKWGFEDERVSLWMEKADKIARNMEIEDARSRTTARQPVSDYPG